MRFTGNTIVEAHTQQAAWQKRKALKTRFRWGVKKHSRQEHKQALKKYLRNHLNGKMNIALTH